MNAARDNVTKIRYYRISSVARDWSLKFLEIHEARSSARWSVLLQQSDPRVLFRILPWAGQYGPSRGGQFELAIDRLAARHDGEPSPGGYDVHAPPQKIHLSFHPRWHQIEDELLPGSDTVKVADPLYVQLHVHNLHGSFIEIYLRRRYKTGC